MQNQWQFEKNGKIKTYKKIEAVSLKQYTTQIKKFDTVRRDGLTGHSV